MPSKMQDLRTRAIVLRRTNYGEADRILRVLTPEGKKSVLAKGVRREKSKLAGGIELFSISDVVIHLGRGELGILTSARLIEHFDALVLDIDLIEQAGVMLKEVDGKAEQVDSPEFFGLLEQALRGMQRHGKDGGCWRELLRVWWSLNLVRVAGEEVNLRFDTDGNKLESDGRYVWDTESEALRKTEQGGINANHIKLMRLIVSSPLELVLKVQNVALLLDEISYIAKCSLG